jgi:hypothetical protein
MAEFLFITPQEMASTTILGGNVDIDKFLFCIANVQLTTIEPLLGSELYDKILTDAENEDLTGDYLTIYNDYVKPITKNESIAQYIEIASYMLTNGGLFKHTGDNIEVVDKQEAQFLAQKYSALAQMYVQRFNKWICKNVVTEYKTYQDGVNAQRDITLTAGWKLNYNNLDDRKWYLQ